MLYIVTSIYLIIGFSIFFWSGAYRALPQPSRLVKVNDDGSYMYKDYFHVPHWLWCITLTIIWLPYLIWFIVMFKRNFRG
ncbi:hypothetical protein EBB07_28710 [Paenibacillaceae bacterium]|nr:hypothetical protein EBB07_28710 [Paenibacillaceae bacterium]